LNFLEENGVPASKPVDDFYDAMIGIAEKRVDKARLAEIFRRHLCG
jgi:prophage maintenance system killer protein